MCTAPKLVMPFNYPAQATLPAHLSSPACLAHTNTRAGGYCMLVGATLKPRIVMDLAAGLVLNVTA